MLHPAAGQRLSLEALSAAADLQPALVERFIEYGLVEPVGIEERGPRFDASAVRRLRMICRLRDDLGINLPGIAAILQLLERIEVLHRMVNKLRRGSR